LSLDAEDLFNLSITASPIGRRTDLVGQYTWAGFVATGAGVVAVRSVVTMWFNGVGHGGCWLGLAVAVLLFGAGSCSGDDQEFSDTFMTYLPGRYQ